MAEKIKAKVVETEEKSIQEKEEAVQKNSGFDEESQMYKVDLSKPPVKQEEPKQEENAVQEQSTDDSDAVVGQSEDSPSSEEVVEEIQDTEEKEVVEINVPAASYH